jgi:hypothetical protein
VLLTENWGDSQKEMAKSLAVHGNLRKFAHQYEQNNLQTQHEKDILISSGLRADHHGKG